MKITKEDIEKFKLGASEFSPNELQELEKQDDNVVAFILGFKKLVKDTGITIVSNDYDDSYVKSLYSSDAVGVIVADGTRNATFAVFSPKRKG